MIERQVIVAQGQRLAFDDLLAADKAVPIEQVGESSGKSEASDVDETLLLTEPELARRQRESAVAALRACAGKISGKGGAAELLALRPTTLSSRLKVWKIDPRDFRKT